MFQVWLDTGALSGRWRGQTFAGHAMTRNVVAPACRLHIDSMSAPDETSSIPSPTYRTPPPKLGKRVATTETPFASGQHSAEAPKQHARAKH